GAHGVFAKVLRYFEHETHFLAGARIGVLGFERVQDRGKVAIELDVDDGADHVGEAAFGGGFRGSVHGLSLSLNGGGAGDDFDQLLGDLRLTGAVHLNGKGVD